MLPARYAWLAALSVLAKPVLLVLEMARERRVSIGIGHTGYRSRRASAGTLLGGHAVKTDINVMIVHKAKGKEFDEVIVFEGSRIGRLLRDNPTERDMEQARLALRAAVTRAAARQC